MLAACAFTKRSEAKADDDETIRQVEKVGSISHRDVESCLMKASLLQTFSLFSACPEHILERKVLVGWPLGILPSS